MTRRGRNPDRDGWRGYASGALVLAIVWICASNASAQRDEFDAPVPPTDVSRTPASVGATRPPPPATPVPTTDTTPDDRSLARIVRVVAVRWIELGAQTPACAHGEIALGEVSSGIGVTSDDGVFVVVPMDVVERAVAVVVHGSDPTSVAAAVVMGRDSSTGLAVLRLLAPMPAADAPAVASGTASLASGDPITAVTRGSDGALLIDRGRLTFVDDSRDAMSISVDGIGPRDTRIIFRQGRIVGVFFGTAASASGVDRNSRAIDPTFASFAPLTALDPPFEESARPAVSEASRLFVMLATATTDEARCAALELARSSFSADSTPPANLRRAELRLLFAALEWNRRAFDPEASNEDGVASAPATLWVEAAFEADTTITGESSFATTLRNRAREEAERARLAHDAAERQARAEQAARDAHARRDRRSDTYTLGLASGFARDGSSGLSGAMVSFGVFGTLPRLAQTGSFRTGAALGASGALGVNSGFSGLATIDLGASARVGGSNGAFVFASYSPGLLRTVLDGAPTFVASGFRVAAGFALGRRAFFAAYRLMTPRSDYPLHLLELGVALRYGAPRVSMSTSATAERAVSSEL